jgi:serine/threonine-protein kinase
MASDLRDRLQAALGAAYRVERELGGGGMSRVFVAEETRLGRRVVVKVLPPELAPGINAERFHREIQLSASLQHPHIVPLLAAGGEGDLFYYTMPLIEGESLRTRLAREGPLPVRDAVRALREVADALAYAHARGVVHRDIKPDNVLISDHHAVVTDFGVAKALSRSGGQSGLTSVGVALGTPAYMAPEQVAGDPNVDHRADIYGLGAMAYEMLAGRPVFRHTSPHQMLAAHVTEPVEPITRHRVDLPPELATLVMRCLDKDPTKRPQGAADVRDALEAIATPTAGTLSTVPVTALGRRRRLRRLAPVAVVLAGAAGWWTVRARPTPALDPDRVAVAPFDVLDPGLTLWREGLVDVLSRSLDGAGPLRTVSPTVVVRRWSGRADPTSARALGQATGARTVVFGGLVGAGEDSVRLTATVLDVASGRAVGEIELRDRASHMDLVADSLAMQVLRKLGQTRPIGLVRSTPLGSTSVAALKAFLQGEQFLRRSEWDSAIVYHQRAIALDSNFALAWSHAGLAAGWAHSAQDSLSRNYKLRAGSLNRSLAPRESLIVQAESLAATVYAGPQRLGGRWWTYGRRMLATLDEAVRRYPTDPELWYMLGDARFHEGALARVRPAQALAAFDRAIALDSAFTPPYVHAIPLALEQQGAAAASRYADAYLRLGAAGEYAAVTQLVARLLDPAAAGSATTGRLLDSIPMHGLLLAIGVFAKFPDSAETAIRLAREHERRMLEIGPADSAQARAPLALSLAFRGHLRAAYQTGVRQFGPLFAQLALLGVVPADTAAAVFRAWVETERPPKYPPWWALPWWTARRDTAGILSLQRWAETRLRSLPDTAPQFAKEVLSYVTQSARAYLTLAHGDTTAALRQLEALPDTACFGSCDLDLLVRAQLLAARGRDRDAAARLEQQPGDGGLGQGISPVRVLWELERARVHERLGNRDTALTAYGFVAAAWARGDPELRAYVDEARAGLKRLGGEPRF